MATVVREGMIEPVFATLAQFEALRQLFVGAVMDFDFLPADPWWVPCYGQTLNVADYPVLAAKRGATGTTFTLPDLRGRVTAGLDNMGGTSANRLTNQTGGLNGDILRAAGGSEVHALTTSQLPGHTHGVAVTGTARTYIRDGYSGNPGSLRVASTNGQNIPETTLDPTALNLSVTETAVGSNQSHNNVQPTIIMVKCILAY